MEEVVCIFGQGKRIRIREKSGNFILQNLWPPWVLLRFNVTYWAFVFHSWQFWPWLWPLCWTLLFQAFSAWLHYILKCNIFRMTLFGPLRYKLIHIVLEFYQNYNHPWWGIISETTVGCNAPYLVEIIWCCFTPTSPHLKFSLYIVTGHF